VQVYVTKGVLEGEVKIGKEKKCNRGKVGFVNLLYICALQWSFVANTKKESADYRHTGWYMAGASFFFLILVGLGTSERLFLKFLGLS
jgi:hypothetical protein